MREKFLKTNFSFLLSKNLESPKCPPPLPVTTSRRLHWSRICMSLYRLKKVYTYKMVQLSVVMLNATMLNVTVPSVKLTLKQFYWIAQGTLTEGEGSVQLTSSLR